MSAPTTAGARRHGRRALAVALVLTGCSLPPTTRGEAGDEAARAQPAASDAARPVEPLPATAATATIVVRHADGTAAANVEVALVESGDWTKIAPIRGRTDAAGRVTLACPAACTVQAWSRQPAAAWQEPSVGMNTYVMPGRTTELRLTPVAFGALDVGAAAPCYATARSFGSFAPLALLPGVAGPRTSTRGAWRWPVAGAPGSDSAPMVVRLAAAGREPTDVEVKPSANADDATTVVDVSRLAVRPWATARLEVELPDGRLLGDAAVELVSRAMWLYEASRGEVYFRHELRHGRRGHVHVPEGDFVVRARVLGAVQQLWQGRVRADTATLRVTLPLELRPVEVTLRGLLAHPVNVVVAANGATHRVGDAPATLFALGAGYGDPAVDAETTRCVVFAPPGEVQIGLAEANAPHRAIGSLQRVRVDAAPDAAPARVTIEVPPR